MQSGVLRKNLPNSGLQLQEPGYRSPSMALGQRYRSRGSSASPKYNVRRGPKPPPLHGRARTQGSVSSSDALNYGCLSQEIAHLIFSLQHRQKAHGCPVLTVSGTRYNALRGKSDLQGFPRDILR